METAVLARVLSSVILLKKIARNLKVDLDTLIISEEDSQAA